MANGQQIWDSSAHQRLCQVTLEGTDVRKHITCYVIQSCGAAEPAMCIGSAVTEVCACCAGGRWAAKLAEQGPSEDLTALAAAAALSVRSTHPISQAVTACVSQLGSALPQTPVDDFRQEPGIELPLSS